MPAAARERIAQNPTHDVHVMFVYVMRTHFCAEQTSSLYELSARAFEHVVIVAAKVADDSALKNTQRNS